MLALRLASQRLTRAAACCAQGWHRPAGYKEVQTPSMDTLVKQGIELDHAYSFKFCSPTRSSLQSGRYPVHVK